MKIAEDGISGDVWMGQPACPNPFHPQVRRSVGKLYTCGKMLTHHYYIIIIMSFLHVISTSCSVELYSLIQCAVIDSVSCVL